MTLGPVVAIGKPGEALSPLGAAREYVHGPGWQDRVRGLLGESSWVVAILGGGEGLKWEYEQILQRDLTGRFILVVPPATPEVFRERWDIFQQASPRERSHLSARRIGGPLCATFPDGQEPYSSAASTRTRRRTTSCLPCSSPRCRLRLLHGARSERTMTGARDDDDQ